MKTEADSQFPPTLGHDLTLSRIVVRTAGDPETRVINGHRCSGSLRHGGLPSEFRRRAGCIRHCVDPTTGQ